MSEVKRYPVYVSHVWEVLAVINCLSPFADRRRQAGHNSGLDRWLQEFLDRLCKMAWYMTEHGKDGIVYFGKSDRDLIEKLSNYVKVNTVMQNQGVQMNEYR